MNPKTTLRTKTVVCLAALVSVAARTAFNAPVPLSLGTAQVDMTQWQKLAGKAAVLQQITSSFTLTECNGNAQLQSIVYQPEKTSPLAGYYVYTYSLDLSGITPIGNIVLFADVDYLAVRAYGWTPYDFDADNQLEDLFQFSSLTAGAVGVAPFTGFSDFWYLEIYFGPSGFLTPGQQTAQVGFISKYGPTTVNAAVDENVEFLSPPGQTLAIGGVPTAALVPEVVFPPGSLMYLILDALQGLSPHFVAGQDEATRKERLQTLLQLASQALSLSLAGNNADALTALRDLASKISAPDSWLACLGSKPELHPPNPTTPPEDSDHHPPQPVHPPSPCARIFLLVQDAIAQLRPP